MNQKLYRSLIESIGIAIKKSINEMARLSVQRTIDKKLWLSVASTCSRNKSTEAENIKPGKGDKDNLLNRYVAALIIMRKPCPQSEDDIDDIKTFKLVGHKYLELGGTIEEIQALYNKNTGKPSTNNTSTKKQVEAKDNTENNKGFDNAVEQKTSGGGLFDDDDIFGDDEVNRALTSDLQKKILDLPKETSLENVLMQSIGITKPRGWKYIKHTNEEYDKFVFNMSGTSITPEYTWSYPKYLKDFINLINSKGWKLYKVEAPSLFGYYRFENMTSAQVKQQIQYACESRYSISKDLTETINKRFKEYEDFINKRRHDIQAIDNNFVKQMFEQDENVYRVFLSPDEGLMLTCTRPKPVNVSYGNSNISKNYYTNYTEWIWTVTFTGNVNDYDEKDKTDIKKLKEDNKKYNKRKKIFRTLLDKRCGLPGYKWTMFNDGNGYPIMVKICSKGQCKITYDNFTKKYYNPYTSKSNYYYIPSDDKTFPNSFKEAVQNKDHWGMSWVRLVCCNNDGKYGHSLYGGSDDEAYMIIMPTYYGKAMIDSLL